VRGLAARIEELDAGLGAVLKAIGPVSTSGALTEALSSVQRTMGGAVELARSGVDRAAAGASTAARTAETVQGLADALTGVARAAREIARVAQQQEGGIEQAQQTVAGIALGTEATMAATSEVEKEARALTDLATALRRAVKAGGEA
jgi:methyl-accepting chemotaxis protein